jgi:hypothetical protein
MMKSKKEEEIVGYKIEKSRNRALESGKGIE